MNCSNIEAYGIRRPILTIGHEVDRWLSETRSSGINGARHPVSVADSEILKKKREMWAVADPKNWKTGRKTIYQLRPHLSQMHTTICMPFIRKKRLFEKKYEPIGGGGAPTAPSPLNPPLEVGNGAGTNLTMGVRPL